MDHSCRGRKDDPRASHELTLTRLDGIRLPVVFAILFYLLYFLIRILENELKFRIRLSSCNPLNHLMKTSFTLITLFVLSVAGCKSNATPNKSSVSTQPIRVSSAGGSAAEPAIAATSEGKVFVVWVDHGQDRKADVMLGRFTSDGQMQDSPVRVNPQPGGATAWRGDPPVVSVAPDQSIVVSWTARVEPDSGHATDLYVSVSRDEGRTFTNPVKVNDDMKPAVHGMHSLTVGRDGRIYVAWLDERNVAPISAHDSKMREASSGHHMESNREVFIASSVDGGRTFSANQRVATNVCPCCKTALAVSDDGRVYISWRQVLPGNFRHIAVASSSDQGKTFSEPKIVSDDQWMLAGCPVSGPAMAVTNDGSLHVLWYSAGKNGETGLYSSESKDGAKSFGPRTFVAKGEIRGTPVLINDGKELAATWENAGGTIMTVSLQSPANADKSPVKIASGGLPAAVQTSKNFITAFSAEVNQQQAVWITVAGRNDVKATAR